MSTLLSVIEPYPWGPVVYGEVPVSTAPLMCAHCGKEFPNHAWYYLFEKGNIAHPCLPEVCGDSAAAIIAEGKKLRASSGTLIPLSDVLAHETEKVVDYILGLKDNPQLTPVEHGYVLLARFPDVRTEHVHHLFDLWSHWLTNKAPEPSLTPAGVHLGTVGERIDLKVTVTRINGPFAGEFGDSYLCIMETEDQNRVIWWTGENLSFEEGHPYTIRGTVKKHDEYDGRKQTQLTRVKEAK